MVFVALPLMLGVTAPAFVHLDQPSQKLVSLLVYCRRESVAIAIIAPDYVTLRPLSERVVNELSPPLRYGCVEDLDTPSPG